IGIKKWQMKEVCEWLSKIGMSKYSQMFQNHFILGKDLLSLNNKDLKYIGIPNRLDRKKILKEIKALNSSIIKIKCENSLNEEIYIIELKRVSTLQELIKKLREYGCQKNFHLKILDKNGNEEILS